MHQGDVGWIVERGVFRQQPHFLEDGFGVLVALLGEIDLMGLFINREIARLGYALAGDRVLFAFLAREHGGHAIHGFIQVGLVFRLSADDERGARFVDQDGVHLVNDGVVQGALHAFERVVDHVVAQVVEAILVVGAVGDVGVVGGLFFLASQGGQVDANAQAQEIVEASHPLGVAAGQIVVDRDHMHPLTGQGVEVHRQRCCQGFAFARAHFGDFAFVQGLSADQLHVEMTHLHHAPAGFAHQGERFW